MSDTDLTVHDLIAALAEREKYRKAHEHLQEYFGLRAELMCQLFGLDLDRRVKELEDLRRSHRATGYGDSESRYEFDGRATRSYLMDCIVLLNRSFIPGATWLEGMPPRIERDIERKYAPQLTVKIDELKKIYHNMIQDLLEFLVPGVAQLVIPQERLFEMGLTREPPDPMEYF